jgi:hypothetical protein
MNVLDRLPQLWGEPANFGEMRSSALDALGDRVTALESIDFAGKKGAKVTQKKNCVKGISCGFSCIRQGAVCRSEMKAKEKEFAGYLKKSAGTTKGKAKADPVEKPPVAAKKDAIPDVKKETIAAKVDKKKTDEGKGTIPDYKKFEDTALTQAAKLSKDDGNDLVPIHKLRDVLGNSVSKGDFNKWLMEMQANGSVQLVGGEMPGLTPQIAEKSIKTALGGNRYYLKTLKKADSAGIDVSQSQKQESGQKKITPIKTEKDFNTKAKSEIDRISKDDGNDLVPIHKLRDALGNSVSKGDFNKWLMEMQANGSVKLIGGEMPGLTPQIAEKSIRTALGGTRYYVQMVK